MAINGPSSANSRTAGLPRTSHNTIEETTGAMMVNRGRRMPAVNHSYAAVNAIAVNPWKTRPGRGWGKLVDEDVLVTNVDAGATHDLVPHARLSATWNDAWFAHNRPVAAVAV